MAGLAALHGVAVLFGLGPFEFWPCAFVATFSLIYAAYGLTTIRQVFAAWFFFASFLTLIPFAWILHTIHGYTGSSYATTTLLALCYAVISQIKILAVFLICHKFHRTIFGAAFAVAALVALCEFFIPEIFVWRYGNTLAGEPHFRQLASIASVSLLSFVAVLGGLILFRIISREIRRAEVIVFAGFTLLGGVLYYWPMPEAKKSAGVLVVQTSIGAAADSKRGDVSFATEAINRLVNQSLAGLSRHKDTNIVIWPEASMPFHSTEKLGESGAMYSETFDGMIEFLHREKNVTLIYHDMVADSGKLRSRFAVRGGTGHYLKRRLVPWGEYLPFEHSAPMLRKFFPNGGRYEPGIEGNEIATHVRGENIRIKPLICYEALYSTDSRIENADLIVNMASDAWFGDGIEGAQHASAALLRAVENGVPMVRAATSGISAMVDFRGDDIVRRTVQGEQDILYAEAMLKRRWTLFQAIGYTAFLTLMLFACFPFFYSVRNKS